MESIEDLVARLRTAKGEADRGAVKALLLERARGPEGAHVREELEGAMKGEVLEVQWEIEEVLDTLAPKKPAPPEPPEEAAPQDEAKDKADKAKGLSSADLVLAYDDPRGLMLHRTKDSARWFATQTDPRTGQPQTVELHTEEIPQVKSQLAGSPYWVLGGS
jgi:hypothetical protein